MVSNLHNQFFTYYKYSSLPIEDHKFWPITQRDSLTWTDDLHLIVYIIIIIPLPITNWGDQMVTPTGLNTKNPSLIYQCRLQMKSKKRLLSNEDSYQKV